MSENKTSFVAGLKEWGRKQIVSLKRAPQKISLVIFLITSIILLFSLNTLSPGPVKDFSRVSWLGLSLFVNTLFSILILVLFLNTFPKHPKVNKKTGKSHKINYVMYALVLVFAVVMILMDILYYNQLLTCINGSEAKFFETMAQAEKYRQYWGSDTIQLDAASYKPYLLKSFTVLITHIVFVCISIVSFVTVPLYGKLLMKINTRKEIASNEMTEVIDTED